MYSTHIAGSSSGRMRVSGTRHRGSNPCPAALRLASLAQCRHGAVRRSVLSEAEGLKFMWYVYILKCENGGLYTGFSTNVEERFIKHKKGKGSSYTQANEPLKVVYTEEFSSRGGALSREAQIKGWRREKKLNLIKFGKPKIS